MARTAGTPGDHHGSEIHKRKDLRRAITEEQHRLGLVLRGLRETREWTRETAAEKIGIHAVHVARIELGSANVTLATLVAMSRAYGVELAVLFVPPRTPTST